jgi:hypothetical protein
MKEPRCGAKTWRGIPCQAAAIWSTRSRRLTRCKNHGGMSPGPKTAEGIERIRRAVTKHGRYTARAKAERAGYHELLRACREMMASPPCNGN